MTGKLASGFLVISTILNCYLVSGSTNYLAQCNSGPHVLIQRTDNSMKCHLCIKCPPGKGMSIKCNGQVVGNTVDIQCMDCEAGVTYSSTTDSGQCIKCPKKCINQEVTGACSQDEDNRECKPCVKGWYFDNVSKKCLFCSCYNTSANVAIRKKCIANGFPIQQCRTITEPTTLAWINSVPTTPAGTSPGAVPKKTNVDGWNDVKTVLLSFGMLILAVIVVAGYFYAIWKRFCKFKVNMLRSPHFKEWMKLILCWPYSTPIVVADGNNIAPFDSTAQSSNGQTCNTFYARQNSLQVTEDEPMEVAEEYVTTKNGNCQCKKKYGTDAITEETIPLVLIPPIECKRARLKVFDMDAEFCRVLFNRLNTDNDIGIGYTTLAGHMDYSAERLSEFKSTLNPAESLVRFWSRIDSNNIFKFAELLEKMNRQDLLELLKRKLPECNCSGCLMV